MNILFLSLAKVNNVRDRGLYTDLVRKLADQGYSVLVVSPIEKDDDMESSIFDNYKNVTILRVKTGNITKTKSKIEKGISTILIEYQFLNAIKKEYNDIAFDMILCSTPPITFNEVIKYFKRKHNSISYLLLKDIFPQNAVDLGFMKKKSIVYKFFRRKEIELYNNSDYIGCMSEANKSYILNHNKYIEPKKVEIFPNAITPIDLSTIHRSKEEVLKELSIPTSKIIYIYGGSLGKPQGIDFLLEISDKFELLKNEFLVIVGSGTEYHRIEKHLETTGNENTLLLNALSKHKYDELLSATDVGIVLLNNRFTIPNFPSRLNSYLENSMPVIAATDCITDLRDAIESGNFGYWCESKSVDDFILNVMKLSDSSIRKSMGGNGREYLQKHYNLEFEVRKILDKIPRENRY